MPTDKAKFVVVVNGAEAHVVADTDATLRVVVERALKETHNTSRPISDWELKDSRGIPLDLDQKIKEFHFPSAVVLYLTLVVGVNGAAISRATRPRVSGT